MGEYSSSRAIYEAHRLTITSAGLHPFALASLADMKLKSQQPYDLTISLTMPRSPANTERGNFMVDVYLLDSQPASWDTITGRGLGEAPFREDHVRLHSRRPAILPYEDPLVGIASRLIFLAYHLIARDTQVLRLDVQMAEKVTLASQQSRMPTWVFVELLAGQTIETYDATVILTAQLRGLRWLMYHYRLPSFVAATAIFWLAETLFMLAAWLAWTRLWVSSGDMPTSFSAPDPPGPVKTIKKEEENLSDIPMTFPTYGTQPSLAYEPGLRDASPERRPEGSLPHDVEADDEADDDGRTLAQGDSGIGTSYSELSKTGEVRRRPSQRATS